MAVQLDGRTSAFLVANNPDQLRMDDLPAFTAAMLDAFAER